MSKDNTYFLLPGSPCLVDTDFITNTFLYFLRRYSVLSTTTIDKPNSHCSTPREYPMFKHSSRACVLEALWLPHIFPQNKYFSPELVSIGLRQADSQF